MTRAGAPFRNSRTGGLDYQSLLTHLKSGRVDPVYLLTGEEDYLIQSATARLTQKAVEPSARDFNLSVFHGESSTADEIRTAIESLPAFAPRRLVILKTADRLAASEANRLVDYLKNPAPTTCFVCIARKFDSRRSFFQTLKANSTVVECRPLSDGQTTTFIRAQAREMGRDISDDAVLFLKERLGRDLFGLKNEITKAAIAIGDANKTRGIELDDVETVCGTAGSASIFDLLNALSARQTEQAIQAVNRLIEEGEPPLRILSTITNRFRLVWRVQKGMRAGFSDNALLRQFGLGQWMGRSVISAAKAYREPDIEWGFKRLMETDAGLKGGMIPPKMMMELLVLNFCSGKRKGLRRFLGSQPLLNL